MGYDYITVSGSTANSGISTMDTSGSDVGTISYRLNWTADGGFTGHGWMFGEDGNGIENWWKTTCERYNLTESENDFKQWVATQPNLDDAFATWNDASKFAFLIGHDEFGFNHDTGEFNSCVDKM